ncbi:Odorant receptor 025 [Nylanderia fulva]|uniref:Odorant receptor n=1 Tax=Nylanderia fulva TaxID=613905 RepID=A0A6G1LPS4_9HYME|nr:odorant receptor 46a-like [Nylanderia fulva]KAF3054234.1 Odorant receptor 025 [Nylanderia fulva]
MDILPVNFKVLWFCGAWKERKDDNIVVACLHSCYKYAIFFLIYQFTIFEVIEVIRTRDQINELTEGLFLASTYVTLCLKYANFLLRKNDISKLLDCLRVKMCQPRNLTEKMIIETHSRKAKWSSLIFLFMSQVTAMGFMIIPILGFGKDEWILPTKAYVPYSVSEVFPYVATYLQQSAALFYAVMLNVSFDSLVYGFTIHACGQIELICRRLSDNIRASVNFKKGSDTNTSIEECVRHHVLVHTFVKKVGALFIWTVMVLFLFSLIILCTSIFLISKTKLFSIEFLSLILYFISMMLQVFLYCWYGNELELKSKSIANSIYFSNWTLTTLRERRSLILIMINSQRGLMFSNNRMFSLSLDTFTWIFKTSYSAFNLLQQASN